MHISYIPGGAAETTVVAKASWIEEAIGNAINNTIVEPFQNWCIGLWNGFVDISLPVCTTVALVALVLNLIGVKKAKQWVIIPFLVYLFIQVANYLMGVGN